MPWDDEFETWSMYLHERVPVARRHAFFRAGEWTADQIAGLFAPHLPGVGFEVVEEPVPTGVGYVLKSREWLLTSLDPDALRDPQTKAARFLRGYVGWLRRRADELENVHA